MRGASVSNDIQIIATGTALGILLVLLGIIAGYILAPYLIDVTTPVEKGENLTQPVWEIMDKQWVKSELENPKSGVQSFPQIKG